MKIITTEEQIKTIDINQRLPWLACLLCLRFAWTVSQSRQVFFFLSEKGEPRKRAAA